MSPLFFASQVDFRNWLVENHLSAAEVIVGFYKVRSGKLNMTWSQSVDQALCFGWIDGLRKSIDADSYCIRFTPRKPDSIWSRVNLDKVELLSQKGLMFPAGVDAYRKRRLDAIGNYRFETEITQLSDSLLSQLRSNQNAWNFFSAQPPSYKKRIIHWIMSAKKETTQQQRLLKTVEMSEKGERIY